jgi:nitrogen-specific signal transduction histidine kinase/CheY-like chemotaxis protein
MAIELSKAACATIHPAAMSVFERVSDGVLIWDIEGCVLYVNPAYEQVSRLEREVFLGRCVHPRAEQGGEGFDTAMANRRLWSGDIDVDLGTGEPLSQVATVTPWCGADGAIQCYVGVLKPGLGMLMTDPHFRHVQKLETLGQLTGGVAHDFNNLLTGILGYADLLKRPPTAERLAHAVASIERTAKRAAQLTKQLLGLARPECEQQGLVDVHTTVEEVVALLNRTISKTIEITQSHTDESAVVWGDSGQLFQSLLNLAINARDAMPLGGRIGFRTAVVNTIPAGHGIPAVVLPGRYVEVSVEDTGSGIAEEVRRRIFEPFFTTKEEGKGTGLGLAMLDAVIKQHHGYVRVMSEVGQGTLFQLYVPVVGATPCAFPSGACPEAVSTRALRVLLVEDEDMVRQVATDLLLELGHSVFPASDGCEALDVYRAPGSAIDVVLLDLAMPKMDGWECLRCLRTIDPSVTVVMTTGYDGEVETSSPLSQGLTAVMKKPYSLNQLSTVLAGAWAARSANVSLDGVSASSPGCHTA